MKLDLKELIAKMLNCDYVIEEGTSGTWTYRKWASGTAECWGEWSSGAFSGTLVNGWYCRVLGSFSFPAGLFIDAPFLSFSLMYWNTGYFWGGVRNVTKDDFSIHVINNSSAAATGNGKFYAKGQWK